MADKRIRITTDISSLREIRNEVNGLTTDVNNLSRASSSALNFDQTDYDNRVENLRQELILQNQLNDLRRPTERQTPTQERVREEIPNIEQPSTRIERTVQEEREEQSPQIERPQIPQRGESTSKSIEELDRILQQNKEDIEELKQQRKTVDRRTTEGKEYYNSASEEIRRLEQSNIEISNLKREQERRGFDPEESGTSQGIERTVIDEDKTKEKARSTEEESKKQTSSLNKADQHLASLVSLAKDRNSILRDLVGDDSGQTGVDASETTSVPTVVPPISGGASGRGAGSGGIGKSMGGGMAGGMAGAVAGAIAGSLTSVMGPLMYGAIESLGRVATAKNVYDGGASVAGSMGQAAGTMVSGIPFVGPLLGGLISGISTLATERIKQAVESADRMQRNVVPYAQVTGMTNSQAMSQGFAQGGFAAAGLGLDDGEYMARRAELLRDAGGKILGRTEEDPTGVNEANSQLAIQHKIGLSDSSVSQLNRTMRFATEGEVKEGSSNNSPSGIIRLFENTMKELKMPFSEIAATMDESLRTFNQVAEKTLDKAGEFDAGKLATVMSSVRQMTNMEGRQLERVQESFAGQGISQDDTTQALLYRSIREAHPEMESFFEIQAKADNLTGDKETLKQFLKNLQDVSTSDNIDTIRYTIEQVFTKLTKNDVLSLTKGGRIDEEGIYNRVISPETALGNEKEAQYDKNYATGVTGDIEKSEKEKNNQKASEGQQMLGTLKEINKHFESLLDQTDLIRLYINGIVNVLEVFTNGPSNIVDSLKDGLKENFSKIATVIASGPAALPLSISKIFGEQAYKAWRDSNKK